MSRPLPSIAYLHECFEHHADGRITWRVRPRHHFCSDRSHLKFSREVAGREVSSLSADGYLYCRITVDGREFRLAAARVAWALNAGAWPQHEIDHINRVRTDNRFENLRDVPHALNVRNSGPRPSKLGVPGVAQKNGRFVARLTINRRLHYLGLFDTIGEASAAYQAASMAARGYVSGVPTL